MAPKWHTQTVADLDRHEGFREFAYPDPLSLLGKKYQNPKYQWGFVPGDVLLAKYGEKEADGRPWTVGYGFTKGVTPASRINKTLAKEQLGKILLEHTQLLDRNIPSWASMPLTIQTVLANLSFNLGSRLLQFKATLALFEKGNYKGAAAHLRATPWFKQVGRRAEELCTRLETGVIEPEHKVV
jgi:lysozyme